MCSFSLPGGSSWQQEVSAGCQEQALTHKGLLEGTYRWRASWPVSPSPCSNVALEDLHSPGKRGGPIFSSCTWHTLPVFILFPAQWCGMEECAKPHSTHSLQKTQGTHVLYPARGWLLGLLFVSSLEVGGLPKSPKQEDGSQQQISRTRRQSGVVHTLVLPPLPGPAFCLVNAHLWSPFKAELWGLLPLFSVGKAPTPRGNCDAYQEPAKRGGHPQRARDREVSTQCLCGCPRSTTGTAGRKVQCLEAQLSSKTELGRVPAGSPVPCLVFHPLNGS